MQRFLIIILVTGFILISAGWRGAEKPRIGVYDSRAIAIAFANSPAGAKYVAQLQERDKNAKASKNDSLHQAIVKEALAHQTLNHLRAFSYGSVAEILAGYKNEMDALAKKHNVVTIVPKFELLCCQNDIEVIDITEDLAKVFNPTEQGLKWVAGIKGVKPLPMLEVLQIPPER